MRSLFVPTILWMVLLSMNSSAEETCGTLSVFFDGPPTQGIYPAQIGAVNGKTKLLEIKEHRLTPGEYELKVYEAISAPELRVDNRHRGYSKALKLTVLPNKVYHIGAKFDHLKPFDRNKFWQPVVWQVTDRVCELK